MDLKGCLLTASLTANAASVLCLLTAVVLKVMVKWRRRRTPNVPPSQMEDFLLKYREQLNVMFVDSLVSLGLFLGGLYLLIGARAVSMPFSIEESQTENFHTATILFSVAIGRHGIAFVMGIRRMHTITSPLSASMSIMQCIDHLVSLGALIIIVAHQEDLLTGTLLLIMNIDHNASTLNMLLDKVESPRLDRVRLGLKVVQCFLSIAFRCAVPLVCTIVSFVVYQGNALRMKPESLAIFVSVGIFYLAYNSWVILNAIRALWLACGNFNKPKGNKEKNAFFANNHSSKDRKVPLTFTLTKENSAKVRETGVIAPSSFTDLDSYLDDHIPPAYENYRRLPTGSQFFRPSLHVSTKNEVMTQTSQLNNMSKTQLDTKLNTHQQKPIKSKACRRMTAVPFSANLPTINEEKTAEFTDIKF